MILPFGALGVAPAAGRTRPTVPSALAQRIRATKPRRLTRCTAPSSSAALRQGVAAGAPRTGGAARRPIAVASPSMDQRDSTVIERVGVVGCGLMGSGIAEVCARAGLGVIGPRGRRRRRRGRPAPGHRQPRPRRALGQADRGGARRRASASSTGRPTWPTWPIATWWSRPWSRTRRSKTEVFARARQGDRARRRHPRLQHLVHPDHEAGHGHRAARSRSSASTSSTRCRCCAWSRS